MKRTGRTFQPTDSARKSALESIRVLVGSLRQSARSVERRTGATNAQVFLLRQLTDEPGLGVSDLAERAQTSQSTASLVIKRLVAAGLVRKQRSAADARKVILMLTPAAHRLVRRAPAPPTALLLEAVQSLSAPQVRELASGLGALVRALGLETRNPPMLFEREARTSR